MFLEVLRAAITTLLVVLSRFKDVELGHDRVVHLHTRAWQLTLHHRRGTRQLLPHVQVILLYQ
jgi:hypothetical protein